MLDDIVSLLGGRIAEKLVLNDISTGASNDLERATAIAKGYGDPLRNERRVRPGGLRHKRRRSFHWARLRAYKELFGENVGGNRR